MSDQADLPYPTSLFVNESNVFSLAWSSSAMQNDDMIRPYSNRTSATNYSDDNDANGAENIRSAFQVARRNARERRRVQSVNTAFSKLHQIVPAELGEHGANAADKTKTCEDAKARRSSKVSILRRAIDYIKLLEEVLLIQNKTAVISYVA